MRGWAKLENPNAMLVRFKLRLKDLLITQTDSDPAAMNDNEDEGAQMGFNGALSVYKGPLRH